MIAAAVPDAAAARRTATAILHEGRFHAPAVPRPLHSILHAIGSAIAGLGSPLSGVGGAGEVIAWIVLATLVALVAAVLARRYSRAALAPGNGAPGSRARATELARELERAADRAEREGRFAEAVRLRFRAGLERLSEQGVIAAARSTPTAELSRAVASSDFETLARRFDEIAYGSAPAGATDAEQARRAWSGLVEGNRRR